MRRKPGLVDGWDAVGCFLILLAALGVLAWWLADPAAPDAPAPADSVTTREVELRESALYDCLTTVPGDTDLRRAFARCGLDWPATPDAAQVRRRRR